jgi:hypothetical protein
MPIRPITKRVVKSPEPRRSAQDYVGEARDEQRPRNMPPNTEPTEGFGLEVDHKLKSAHSTLDAAMKVGANLKRRFPVLRVTIHDAAAKTRIEVEAAR